MTRVSEREVACAVCGHTQAVYVLMSTNRFGPADLDTRPPEMQRSTMPMWLAECEGCGYTSAELDTADDVAGVESDATEQRLTALDRFERARADGKPAIATELTFYGVVVDLARRTRQFDKALAYCELGCALDLDDETTEAVPFHQRLFALQGRLCEAEDSARHHMGEIDV
jgi:hypothetical protein